MIGGGILEPCRARGNLTALESREATMTKVGRFTMWVVLAAIAIVLVFLLSRLR